MDSGVGIMAYKLYTKGLDEMYETLAKIKPQKVTGLMKRAIYDSAGLTADNVRGMLNSHVSDEATGDLARGININKMSAKNGNVYTSVGFDGYDRNGQPLPVIAAVLESGRSDQPGRRKTHFFSKAVRASRGPALNAAEETFLQGLEKELGE